jgi:ATP-dependent metalloprotease
MMCSISAGKTLLARAVAGEANVPFFAVSGSDFEEMYQGLGAQRVRTLFSAARKLKKAIIFIDEIDTIGGKRSVQLLDVADHDRSVLNQLLSEMDGYVSTPGVIVIAATNYAETLDPALLRPGRFDRHVVVGLPDIKGRREILEYYGRKLKLDPKVNLGVLARGTAGMTGADLSQLLNAAALRASANNQSVVTLADLEHAKDTVMMGVARTSGVLTPEMRRHLAYYHAGRSLVSLHTTHSLPVHKVTIMQRGEHLGAVALQQDSDDDRTSSSYSEMLAQLDLHLGGRAAEELVYGVDEVTSHGTGDLSRAASLARTMVMEYGFGARHGPVSDNAEDPSFAERASDATKSSVDAEVRALLQASHARARALLARHQEELHRVAEALIKHETLDGRELKLVAEGKEIDKPVVEARTFADGDAAPAPEPEASAAPA